MLNRIIRVLIGCVVMNPCVCAGSKVLPKAARYSSALTEEVHQHRLTQSALSTPSDIIKGDRHRFVLSRFEALNSNSNAKTKARTKARTKANAKAKVSVKPKKLVANVKVLSEEKFEEPRLPKEEKKHTLYANQTKTDAKPKFNWTMMHPVKGGVSHKFGEGSRSLSQGVVYTIRANQSVRAPMGGIVIFSGAMKEFEHVVMIEKDLENIILVAGIHTANVKQGDKVHRGQKIGAVVKGGWIYVEFRNLGIPIDPQQMLVSGSVNEE
jgi:septal ring factor EnvC (AmiA/AmiB activator)